MTRCHDCNNESSYDFTWREHGKEFLICYSCAEMRFAEITARKGRPLTSADLIEEARREGGNPEAGGHAEIAILKRTIEDLQHEVFLLKRKVDDFNTIIRPVYEEAMVRLKALVAEAQEIIRNAGAADGNAGERIKDWLRRSENA